jgi:methyltransferase (TIGR00027 family)
MTSYLAARTSFFDRAVVRALDRGVAQVVIAAAGYDGRALRYAKAGVRWFEVDHPDTQRDKRDRLQRLGIPTEHVTFVPADFAIDDVAAAVVQAGYRPDVPSLFLCEGVAIYLERDVLASLLSQLRRLACGGTELAVSLSVASTDPLLTARRAAFREAVAAMGEPARTVLEVEEMDALLARTGWALAPASLATASERARRAGMIILQPASLATVC